MTKVLLAVTVFLLFFPYMIVTVFIFLHYCYWQKKYNRRTITERLEGEGGGNDWILPGSLGIASDYKVLPPLVIVGGDKKKHE